MLLSACAPGYLLRAAYEQTDILARRQSIDKLIKQPETDEVTRKKLKLVLEAREFAEEIGLTPRASFTKYTQIDRDVLLWVLSASEKASFKPYTWWFPIVGTVPYKGFFDKSEGLAELEKLKQKDLDVVLRSSPAFSTLGWFNDPLLSTTLQADEVSLVNIVIHEILHSTVWIPGSVSFNESLANFVGHQGAIEFFRKRYPSSEWVVIAERRWQEELEYAAFFKELQDNLARLYERGVAEHPKESKLTREEILAYREEIFANAKFAGNSRRAKIKLNNAVIIGQRLYLDSLDVFELHYQSTGGTLKKFANSIVSLKDALTAAPEGPFLKLRSLTASPHNKLIIPKT